jgi:hypothetical protein
MGVLRELGDRMFQQGNISAGSKRAVYKKDNKYYEKLHGIEITKDEVGDRMVISFDNDKTPFVKPLRKAKRI